MASRSQLFHKLGLMTPIVDPLLSAIYKAEEEQIFKQDLQSSPHGEHWSTSFHSSAFPGDNPKACARKSLYTMMNVPQVSPIDRALRQYADLGNSLETDIVWRLYRSGLLLSNPPSEQHQTSLIDEEAWLTCAPDAIINLPRKNRPFPIEIKTRSLQKLEEMKKGERSYEEGHRIQLLTQISLTVLAQEKGLLWDDLNLCQDGALYYVARDNPSFAHEFRFEYDPGFYEQGKETLKEWAASFKNDKLPARPKEWKWTDEPCKYCAFKKEVCKPDNKEGITDLKESHGVQWARQVKGNYDYDEQKQRVLDRWED